MAFTNEIIFEVIEPKSFTDSSYSDFEYLLEWYGNDGAYYQYLFEDQTVNETIEASVINERDRVNIRSLISGRERTVRLTAEDLSLNDYNILSTILTSEHIVRKLLSGEGEPVAINRNSISYNKSDGRYNLTFDIKLWNLR